MPAPWTIYYGDGSEVHGLTREDWDAAPDDGVQVVVEWRAYDAPHLSPWARCWDRRPETGIEQYDPFGWGPKRGSLIPDADYERIWRHAFYGPRP